MSNKSEDSYDESEYLPRLYVVMLCDACIEGKREICHTPGCLLIRHWVDMPIGREILEEVEYSEALEAYVPLENTALPQEK